MTRKKTFTFFCRVVVLVVPSHFRESCFSLPINACKELGNTNLLKISAWEAKVLCVVTECREEGEKRLSSLDEGVMRAL